MIGAACAALLGAVFVVSGVAKLARPAQWRAQAAELGAPRPVIEALPFIELLLGALLIVQWHRRWVALGALVLLGGFTVLLVARLLQGRRPPCACFGSWSMKPIGWGHVARNAGFMAIAVIAMVAG